MSGLSENYARIAPVFDLNGNEIVVKNKSKIVYESQECSSKLTLQKLSGLYKSNAANIVFQEVYSQEHDGKVTHYMKNPTLVDNVGWLQDLCSPILLSFSKPLTEIGMKLAASAQTLSKVDFIVAKEMAK